MKLLPFITVAIAGACLTALFHYLRPPQGDKLPVSQEWLTKLDYDKKGFDPHGEG